MAAQAMIAQPTGIPSTMVDVREPIASAAPTARRQPSSAAAAA